MLYQIFHCAVQLLSIKTVSEMEDLKLIQENLYNFAWFRLSKYFNKHFNNHSVNETVYNLYQEQLSWTKKTRKMAKDLASNMFHSNGYPQFCQLVSELKNPAIERERLLIIIYLCIQICRLYIMHGETFAVKYFIIEMQKNMAKAVNKVYNM